MAFSTLQPADEAHSVIERRAWSDVLAAASRDARRRLGISSAEVGGATALRVRGVPSILFNRVMRLARLSRASKQPDGWLMIATYEEGLQFFLTLEAHGIDPEKVLDSPPVSMSQLLHPGKLFEQVEPTLELASLWDTLRSMASRASKS